MESSGSSDTSVTDDAVGLMHIHLSTSEYLRAQGEDKGKDGKTDGQGSGEIPHGNRRYEDKERERERELEERHNGGEGGNEPERTCADCLTLRRLEEKRKKANGFPDFNLE
ncbi:hypothetical protein E1301_Tti011269 [Triplophysa tibetana]|uniref:Uncharacterized protein n=1 Tax=Triplophysa tibetana TaxID=1572043 RepID=A0A5A9N0G3_9TELE|nr:hypothetical protein E1301_Tti011269 [Triplophysa tibetana]